VHGVFGAGKTRAMAVVLVALSIVFFYAPGRCLDENVAAKVING